MGSWFLEKKQNGQQQPAMTALRIQSSLQGTPWPLLWGRNRLAGNLIWYGDFTAWPVNNAKQGGGKGGGGENSGSGSVTYNYSASFAIGICQGPIRDVRTTWVNKAIASASGLGSTTTPKFDGVDNFFNLGFEVFTGTETQLPWGYLSSVHPTEALNYRELSYVAQPNVQLGDSAELPLYSFEVTGEIAFGAGEAATDLPDANPRDVVVDYLTDPLRGLPGWPAARLATLDQYATYALALGLLVSPIETEAREASAFLSDLFEATNSVPRWSSGKLDVIPLGDTVVTGNGVTFTPDVTPLFDLTNDDLLPIDDGNVIGVNRKPPNTRLNVVRMECLDRLNNYDPVVIDDKDEASIQQYGPRPGDVVRAHFFCLAAAARLSVHLKLLRQQIANTYTFMLPPRFIVLDIEDLVTLTRPEIALVRQPVRIIEIAEGDDGSLTFTAEEYLGTAGAPLFGTEATAGYVPNTNAAPGGINDPLIFEPTDELGGGLWVWAAVSGADPSNWGGCNVYASYDDVTYSYIGRQVGPARTGVLTAGLPSFPTNLIGPTIDTVNTLKVDLSQSGGELVSATQADALALNTACYVGGEIIAYETATLTGPNAYDLTYLVRDAFGTEANNVLHPVGTRVARLDSQILKIPYDQTRIGSTIYLKFQSFNPWGGGQQDVSALAPYLYKLTGVALTSPLPNVTDVRTVFEAGFTKIWWEEVNDFRNGIRYIIRKGDTFEGGQDLGTLAHPPFIAFGAGTYWIRAICQPLADLFVYSETPESITIQGNMLTENIIQTTDFQALGWPGIYTNVGKEGTDPTAVLRLVGAESILDNPDILNTPNILDSGIIAIDGTYTTDPVSTTLNVGYVADCAVNITWTTAGIHIGADILADPDFLNNPDVLSAATGAYVAVWIEVRTATTSTGDVYAPTDIFDTTDVPDVYYADVQWGAWQRYVPGVYRAQFIQYRARFTTLDPSVIAYLRSMLVQVTIPARVDHYIGNTVPGTTPGPAGLTITFEPDDAAAAKPFNGGPLVGGAGNHPLPAITISWPGHAGINYVIDSLTLSAVTFHFVDGSGVPLTGSVTGVNIVATGY